MATEIKKILYATDLGTHMRPVFRYAVALARACGAKINMLHVSDVFTADGDEVLDVTHRLVEARLTERGRR